MSDPCTPRQELRCRERLLDAKTKVESEATPGSDDNNDDNFNKEQPLDAVKSDESSTVVEERRATTLLAPPRKRVAISLTANQKDG